MNLLKGIASKVEHEVVHYPGRLRASEGRTVHILKFEVRGWPAKFESTQRQGIKDGDHVVLAGTAYKRSFVAVAYRNLTTGAEGHESPLRWMIVGVVFSVVGLLMPYYFFFVLDWRQANSVVGLALAALLFFGLFGFLGVVGVRTALKTRRAIKALREASLSPADLSAPTP